MPKFDTGLLQARLLFVSSGVFAEVFAVVETLSYIKVLATRSNQCFLRLAATMIPSVPGRRTQDAFVTMAIMAFTCTYEGKGPICCSLCHF
jgi:hypothetical protein